MTINTINIREIKEQYPLLYKRILDIRNKEDASTGKKASNGFSDVELKLSISSIFIFNKTREGHFFWRTFLAGDIERARIIFPEYFVK
jgi:hypothetical protein